MSHQFLSDEWFAALAEIFDRDGVPDIPEKLQNIVLNVNATDGDRVTKVTYRSCYFQPGHSDDAAAELTTPRDLCYQVFIEKKMAHGVRALATGKAKLKGDRNQMMPIRAVKPTPTQAEFERKVLEMTTV